MNLRHCFQIGWWNWRKEIRFTFIVVDLQARTGKLSEKGVEFIGGISGWTATLLFMWMPVSQLVNFIYNDNFSCSKSSVIHLLSPMNFYYDSFFLSSGQIFSILRTWKACLLFLCCLRCLEMDSCFHVLYSFAISCGNSLSSIDSSFVLFITNHGHTKLWVMNGISLIYPSFFWVLFSISKWCVAIFWNCF